MGCYAGYPFYIPPRGADFWTYCVLVYHTPLLIAFSAAQVDWGGRGGSCACVVCVFGGGAEWGAERWRPVEGADA